MLRTDGGSRIARGVREEVFPDATPSDEPQELETFVRHGEEYADVPGPVVGHRQYRPHSLTVKVRLGGFEGSRGRARRIYGALDVLDLC